MNRLLILCSILLSLHCDSYHLNQVNLRLSSIPSIRTTFGLYAVNNNNNNNNNHHIPLSTSDTIKNSITKPLVSLTTTASSLILALTLLQPTQPAQAVGSSTLEEANKKLASYDFPPILFNPPGFIPLVSEFGRGGLKEKMSVPILVQFSHPAAWVQQKTTVNKNGEAGTIAANDYMKGDTAFLFVTPSKEAISEDKSFFKSFLLKSLSQKGDPVDDLVVSNIKQSYSDTFGQKYYTADFKYKLNTEAGFIVARKGFLSLTSVGGNIQSLIAITTDLRFKKLEADLRAITDTFRVYRLNSGLFAAEQ